MVHINSSVDDGHYNIARFLRERSQGGESVVSKRGKNIFGGIVLVIMTKTQSKGEANSLQSKIDFVRNLAASVQKFLNIKKSPNDCSGFSGH
ncbi:hypothetical protein [Bdellovibrio bacteriovorus]|uniref:hypothetical protein n=1 Tax=Bdellovibrio bacteriovorus TaxID=959 RepID=UPI0035A8B5C1